MGREYGGLASSEQLAESSFSRRTEETLVLQNGGAVHCFSMQIIKQIIIVICGELLAISADSSLSCNRR